MKKLLVIMGMAAVLSIAGLAVMADQEQPAGMPDMEYGAPPEMKQMAFMEGVWDVSTKFRMGPDEPWVEETAVNTNSIILDGCVIESEYEGEMMGMPFKGVSMTCYNPIRGKWQTMWTDNMGMGMSMYDGGFDGDKIVFAGEDVMPGGIKALTRITSYNITDTSYDWLMEMSMDGGKTWIESMKASYTKR